MIQKVERDKLQSDIEHLKTSIEQLKMTNDIKMEHELGKKNQRLQSLMMEIENKEIENSSRHDTLVTSMKEMKKMNEEKIH